MSKPEYWNPYDPITAQRLNDMRNEALRSRKTTVHGPNVSMVGDNIGAISAHHAKPAVALCVAMENFVANTVTDNYLSIDSTPSGLCVLVRFDKETGGYVEETGFEPFRVWDPIAEMTDSSSKQEGDIFHAVYNKDSQRMEVVAGSSGVIIRHGITQECVGKGFYKIELMDCIQYYPPVCDVTDPWPSVSLSLSGSASASASIDPCDLCDIDPECQGKDFRDLINCQQIGYVDPARPRENSPCYPLVGNGEIILALDKRAVPLKISGMVTIAWLGDYCKPPCPPAAGSIDVRVEGCSESCSTSSSASASASVEKVKIWVVLNGEYQLVGIPHEEYECCADGTVKKVKCTTFIVEGDYCESPRDSCSSSGSV